jgi:hypothetical protein
MNPRTHILLSDLFIALYVLATLGLRFYLEPQLQGNFLLSVAIGAFALLFLWALIKAKILRPSILGLGK